MKKWIGSLLLMVAVTVGVGSALAGELETSLEKGRIMEIHLASGYMILNEARILLDRETVAQTQKEEAMEIKDLKAGMHVAVFLEKRNGEMRAIRIDLLLDQTQKETK